MRTCWCRLPPCAVPAHSLLMELLHEHLQEHVVGADDPQQRADEAAVLVELLRRYGK